MSALTEKVAREHGTYGRDEAGCYCIGCGSTLPNAEIAQHIAEVTEAETRAALAAALDVGELAAVIDRADDDWQHGIGASGTTWDRAIAHAVRDYLTGNESDESHE